MGNKLKWELGPISVEIGALRVDFSNLPNSFVVVQILSMKETFEQKSVDWMDTTVLDSWLLNVLLISLSIGTVSGFIFVSTAWLSDLKQGFCSFDWYLSRDICCKYSDSNMGSACPDFPNWSQIIFGSDYYLVDYLAFVFFSTSLAGLSALLLNRLPSFAAGSGVPNLISYLDGFIANGFLSFKTCLVKCIALPLAVASGLSVGKEGPMIHIAAAIGDLIAKKLHLRNQVRRLELVSAASAAGVGITFGSPIGGVLFALEELCSFFPTHTMIKSFFAALVGTVVIQLIDPYRGKRVMYQVRLEETFYLFEMTSFILIGCIGGLLGAFFTKVIRRISTMNLDIFKRPILFASLIALFTSAIAYFNVFTRIDESELLENLFSDCANESADLCQYVNLT